MKGRVRGEKIISVEEHGKDSAPGQHSNIHLCPCVLIFSTSAEKKTINQLLLRAGTTDKLIFWSIIRHAATSMSRQDGRLINKAS